MDRSVGGCSLQSRLHPGVAGSSPCLSSAHLMATLPDGEPCCLMAGIWPSLASCDREYIHHYLCVFLPSHIHDVAKGCFLVQAIYSRAGLKCMQYLENFLRVIILVCRQ